MKKILVTHPWMNLYGGGEIFCKHCCELLSKKFEVNLMFYNNNKKVNKFLKINKKIKLIPVKSKSKIINYLASKTMVVAQTYLIYFINNKNKIRYEFIFSSAGEIYSKLKTYQYLHMCFFSINLFEYKNFGYSLKTAHKAILRLLVVLFSRIFLFINKNKFNDVITISNSNWSLSRIAKTYIIKKKKLVYPTFNIVRYKNNNLKLFNNRLKDFVILGRVSEDKKIHEGINFFNSLGKKFSSSRLHIIGPIDRQYFKKKILKIHYDKKKIIFHGLISSKERNKILYKSMYGLSFFNSEHFGRGVLEMQKLGMIVFAKNKGGVREILFNNYTKYNGIIDLIKKINEVDASNEIKNKILMINKNKFKKYFTNNEFNKKFLNIFKI